MTHNEIVDLLTVISAYDNRKPNPAAVLAWGKAAELGRWTFLEATDAVHAHFSEDPAYLMPAHITVRVKAARQDRAMRAEALAIEAAPVDVEAAARVQAAVADLAKTMGWSDRHESRSPYALRVPCPHCGAAAGARCVARSTGKPLAQSACHPSRADALADTLRGETA